VFFNKAHSHILFFSQYNSLSMLHIFISTGQIRNIVGNILTLFLLVGLFCGVVYGWLWVTKNSCERNLCVPDSLNIVTLALAGSLLNP
jgi:hypothetical protein